MKKLLLLFLFGLLLSATVGAQGGLSPCGTAPGLSNWLKAYQQNPAAYPRSPDVLYLPLSIHLVGDEAGQGRFSEEALLDAFCSLNADFEEAGIQFFFEGGFHYISHAVFYDHTYMQGIAMMEKHNIPNTINCYFVGNAAGNCGYALYDIGVALSAECLGADDHTWAHEMGHLLSLPHTFAGWEGTNYGGLESTPSTLNGREVERLARSNCTTAGDGFCDTPPDYLSNPWACRENGNSQLLQKDPEGQSFYSDGSLLMSYALGGCANRFSGEQIAAMRANVLDQQQTLLDEENQAVYLSKADAVALSPIEGTLVTDVSSITLEWEPVPEAEGYLVQLMLISPQGEELVYDTYHLTGNRLELSGLLSDRDWLWKIRPYNRYDGCTNYSNAFSFETGNFINSTRDQAALNNFSVQPNPQQAGREVLLQYELPIALELNLSLYTLAGQRVYSQPVQGHFGRNELAISTTSLEPGAYFISLEHTRGRQFQKLIIQ